MSLERAVAAGAPLLCAVAVDLAWGEPSARAHPVVWMGRLGSALERLGPRRGRLGQLVAGFLVLGAVTGVFTLVSAGIFASISRWTSSWASGPALFIEVLVLTLLLKPMFALRALGQAGRSLAETLGTGDLEAARVGLQSLCSRDASGLDSGQLSAAAVESLAENASDSFVAPLFYYALFGLPGAVFYRAVNTLDAMFGYRGRWEYFGKTTARLDDLLNLLPARITAGLLLTAGAIAGADVRRGWRVLRRDGARTESPNAGRPMAAMAGLLGLALEKVGHYRLGDAARPLTAATIEDAWRLVKIAAGFWTLLTLAAVTAHALYL